MSRKFLGVLLGVLTINVVANFLVFTALYALLEGDAWNGYLVNGRYFVCDKGTCSEVSRAFFALSLWQERVAFFSAILWAAVLGYLILNDHLDFLREFFIGKSLGPRETATRTRVRSYLIAVAWLVGALAFVFFGRSLLIRVIVVGVVILIFLRAIATLLSRWNRRATK
jgi:hypothetical protein